MSEGTTTEGPASASRWSEAAERLRSNARVFVVSLGAVAVTVVAGLSLTGLSTLDPQSPNFWFAVSGALAAIVGVVVMLALLLRLASASAVSVSELIEAKGYKRGGYLYAQGIVSEKANGYLAGFDTLEKFSEAFDGAIKREKNSLDAAVSAPTDKGAFEKYKAARMKREWYDARLSSLVGAASFKRLQWNFGKTAIYMAIAGVVTAVGIVMYAAALQPRGVPSTPVAVTTHESIQIRVPEGSAAAALYESVVGCSENVQALVVSVKGDKISAITIPESGCQSVTVNAVWDGTGYVANFDSSED